MLAEVSRRGWALAAGGRGEVRAGLVTMRLAYPDIVVASKLVSPLSGYGRWHTVYTRMSRCAGPRRALSASELGQP